MDTTVNRAGWHPLEIRTVSVGFLLAGLAVALTTVSFALHTTFPYRWLVWGCTAGFAAVALVALEWPRALRQLGELPMGGQRRFFLLAVPLAFILNSQVCGLGVTACSGVCNGISFALVGLAVVTSVHLSRSQPVGPLLVPMVVLGVVPHCICNVNANVLWHSTVGLSPACEVVPLTAALFSISALRGVRPSGSVAVVAVLLGMIVFMAVGSNVYGFPWQVCVNQAR